MRMANVMSKPQAWHQESTSNRDFHIIVQGYSAGFFVLSQSGLNCNIG